MHPMSGSVGVPSGSNASGMPSGTYQGSQQSSSDRKLNLIFFGISESPTGTHFNERLKQDYNPFFTAIDPLVEISHLHAAISACTRLGRFNASSPHPRPLLIEFNNVSIIPTILRNHHRLPSNISVKCDLSKKECQCNSILLKERFRLITEDGVSKSVIEF